MSVSEDRIEQLPPKSYYHFEIIGINVVDDELGEIGAITEILTTGGNDVYVARNDAGEEILFPAIASVILEVDTDAQQMKVRIPPTI